MPPAVAGDGVRGAGRGAGEDEGRANQMTLMDQQCFVKEPEHSLNVIKNFEQKYGMTFGEARVSGLACSRDLAAWEHALEVVVLATGGSGGASTAVDTGAGERRPAR